MPRLIELHATSQQGRRPTNEDVELFRINLGGNGQAYDPRYAAVDTFVVCDGHGGSEVSAYAAPQLLKCFTRPNLVFPLAYNLISKIYDRIQGDIIDHPDKIGAECGCTALVVVRYIDGARECIQVINLGDCRAVLSRKGLAIPLTKDHKPFWPEEKRRIDLVNRKHGTDDRVHFEAGDWRIHDLSVSRAFGDLEATPHVTHLPETFIYSLQNDDEFIIIACDGLWDTLENHEAVNFARDHLTNNGIQYYDIPRTYPTREVSDTQCLSRKLASYAIARGSTDNVSVLTVILK